jgi:GxxExxY protein
MNHEGHEGHEGFKPFSMRLSSPLSVEAEEAMSETIGCAIAVHRALGPGFLESIYKKAMYIELDAQGISYESEKAITVTYRGREIQGQRVDLVVRNLIVVELKAIARFDDVHQAQVTSYLKTTGLRGVVDQLPSSSVEGWPTASRVMTQHFGPRTLRDLRALRG